MIYGVPYELFWRFNPKKIEPFKMAYEEKVKIADWERWQYGLYNRMAISSAINGGEYPEKPFMEENDSVDLESSEEKELTEEQILALREQFVMQLQIMEANNTRYKAKKEAEELLKG